ncbi:MAG: DNA-binding protein WhiA [Lachnospiraceae bacterium]|nr:DNA-binding protein WhiA [Candidatus Minthocola equi]
MTFANQVKTELTEKIDQTRHCKLAVLLAIFSVNGAYIVRRDGKVFPAFITENRYAAVLAATLIRRLYHEYPEVSVRAERPAVYTVYVASPEKAEDMLSEMKLLSKSGALWDVDMPLGKLLPANICCRRAFLRGLFICSGSINNPNKSYHMEIVCKSEERAHEISKLLSDFEVKTRIRVRRGDYVIYIKDGDGISDFLSVIGASSALLDMENTRILRDISGNVNRKVNCETSNLHKTVSAGLAQVRDIEIIADGPGLSSLPDELKELAELRLENPDMSIEALGQLLTKKIGKSGVYHRFEKLHKIAEEIRI